MQPLSDNPNDFCFLDTESRALRGIADELADDLITAGVDVYSKSSRTIMVQYAIGETGDVRLVENKDFSTSLRWADLPPDLLDFHARVLRGEAWYVAWNSRFDRWQMNAGMVATRRDPMIPVRGMLDAMAQATGSNLPGGLDRAHKAIGGKGKLPDGKHLIKMFCTPDGKTPQEAPEDWNTFCDYGIEDVEALRETFLTTRPLWDWEWEQFWASEAVNDRGLPIDRKFVERAAYLAELYVAEVDERIKQFSHYDPATDEGLRTVNQHQKMAGYVYDHLEHIPEACDILTKEYSPDDEGELQPSKMSVERKRVEKLLALLETLDKEQGLTDDEFDILQLLEVREFGASATPKKFAKILRMLTDDDRLGGQYQFNGAQQTGRYSSRGVQTHNLTRKALVDEADAINAILDIEVPK